MKFDEYAAQVSLGTLLPKTQEEWLALIDDAVEPQLLSRLFADFFVRAEQQPQNPSTLSSPSVSAAWQRLLLAKNPAPAPAQVDEAVLHILSNTALDLSVLENMLGTGRLEDKHVGLFAFSHLVTPDVIEKWTFLYPSVLSCEVMQLKRAFAKHPAQVLHYGTKMLTVATPNKAYYTFPCKQNQIIGANQNKDYFTYQESLLDTTKYAGLGSLLSWTSTNTKGNTEEDKK